MTLEDLDVRLNRLETILETDLDFIVRRGYERIYNQELFALIQSDGPEILLPHLVWFTEYIEKTRGYW